MRFLFAVCFVVIGLPPSGISQSSIGWHGIVPLRSTRTEVERLLGSPSGECQCIYKSEREVTYVTYAKNVCKGDLAGWKVSTDTVLSLTVSPDKKPMFSKLELDTSHFVKITDDTFTTHYANGDTGIRYAVSSDGLVQTVSYIPSSRDNHLRCPGFPRSYASVAEYQPFDSFVVNSFEDATARLDTFAFQLNSISTLKGYVLVYAGGAKQKDEASAYATRAKSYLMEKRNVDAERIVAINGGYRKHFTIELYLIPSNWNPPIPTPTLGRSGAGNSGRKTRSTKSPRIWN